MTGARALTTRRPLAALLLTAGLVLMLAVGCSDDDSNPTFPDHPEIPVGNWFLGIWGSGPDDIFVVGQPGLIYHWNGDSWQREQSGTQVALTDVWGDDTGTVYATGHRGVILRRNAGGSWSSMNSGTDKNLFSINTYQGRIMAAGQNGTLRELVGQNWQQAPQLVYTRAPDQAVLDTLYLNEDFRSLTAVAHHGITGADGVILMSDPEADWQRRRIRGGQVLVTCATSNSNRLSGNFIATDSGELFQLSLADDRLVWNARYSPALDATIYGIYTDNADTVWAVTNDGRINRVAPDNTFAALYEDELMLFDIWGTSGTNLYAVGIGGRVLRFHLIAEDEYGWEQIELPDLPETKNQATHVFDKFGRPVLR
jgi:hypothetical protein